MSETRNPFVSIYAAGGWNGCGSGVGSTEVGTRSYRNFMNQKGIRTVLDIGCGDWQFMWMMDWEDREYLGLDVVPALIERNSQTFKAPNVKFGLVGLDFKGIPLDREFDLMICKDVIQHWPLAMVTRFLKLPIRAKHKLVTNCWWWENLDIELGGFAPRDLSAPPWQVRGEYALDYEDAGTKKRVFHIQSDL